jgi:hypothetical protein
VHASHDLSKDWYLAGWPLQGWFLRPSVSYNPTAVS